MNKLAMALLATTVLAATPALAGNELTNGSFETGDLTGWTVGGTSTGGYPPVVITNLSGAGYPTGAFGEVVPNDNNASNPNFDDAGTHGLYFVADLAHPQTLTQSVSVVEGVQYTFGFDMYQPGNGAANPNDASLTATVGGLIFENFLASDSPIKEWTHFSSTGYGVFTTTADFVFEYNSFGYPAKDFVIDRVYFAPTVDTRDGGGGVPEPASWALMISGFGMAGAMLRHRKAVAA